jgi:hypothetical protein
MPTTPETQADRSTPIDVRLKRALESRSLPKQLLIDSGAGTGKTYGILSVLHCLASDYSGLRLLFVRETRKSLTESVMATYERFILPADGMESIARGASRKFRDSYPYPNGSMIGLGGMDNPDRILSTDWDIIYVNECIGVTEEAWDTIWGRLNRPGSRKGFGFLIGDTNPDPSHFLKKRADAGEVGRWTVDHRANPAMWDRRRRDWTEAGRLYLDSLGRLKGTRRKRFLEGVWAAGEGQWFDTFTDANVTDLADYDPALPVHLAVDSGVHTGAVWFQIRGEGDATVVTVFADLYETPAVAFKVAGQILEKSTAMGVRPNRRTTDPAGKAANAVSESNVLAEYRRAGLHLDPWPLSTVADSLALLDSFVSVDPPGLLVHPRCTALIDAFANYRRAKRGGQFVDRPEDPQHPHEEMIDALRGGLQDKYPHGRARKLAFRPAVESGPGWGSLNGAR